MLAQIGYGALFLTFLLAFFCVISAVVGYFAKSYRWVEYSRWGFLAFFPIVTLAGLILVYLLVTGHYEIKYVYSVTSSDMPGYLKATALWGGQAGSLLLWSWLLSAIASLVALRKWDGERDLLPWVIVTISITLAFFVSLSLFIENPFLRWWQTATGDFVARMFIPKGATAIFPEDGQGLNPLLRHPGMIIHPPMLYLGYVCFIIPYAFAIATLVTGRSDNGWIRITRRWTLVAWLFLSVGIVLGMWWAYDILGWGGYWSWDPVETASLLPWLSGTAYLHSVMIQEKRGIFKQWNMLLIILTYSLVIFGTFLTRSGIFSSVHAFSQSAIGPMFFTYIGISLVVSTALLINRWKTLHAEIVMKSFFSREALFLLNNLLFIGILIVCFWGVTFPIISDLFTGQKVTVGPPFYQRAAGPLFGALMVIMGIAPFTRWDRSLVGIKLFDVWKPVIFALLTTIIFVFMGMRNWIALTGFTLIAFVLFTIIFEYWRGVQSLHRATKESLLISLLKLVGLHRRKYGADLVHAGMVVMAIGILGMELFQTTTQKTLNVGDRIELGGYSLRYDALAQFPYSDGRFITKATMSIFREGEFIGKLYPRYDFYTSSSQVVTVPGVRSTLSDDLYVVLVNWEKISLSQAPFKVYYNPLINWLWIGSLLFILGFLMAVWTDGRKEQPK